MKNLSAFQYYYTSCVKGLSGNLGYQIRSISPGLSPEDQGELLKRSNYLKPNDLPDEPVPQGNTADYPVSLASFRLTSGRLAIVRSVYVGRDYSGRLGNFSTHALVYDDPGPDFWPLDTYSWPGWKNALTPEEDQLPSQPLTPVPLAETAAAAFMDFEEISSFLNGNSNPLADLIRAVFRRPIDYRVLVIRTLNYHDGARWIACLLKAFPAALRGELTASSYQFDSKSVLAINATVMGTDFAFKSQDINYQYYGFDFAENNFSSVPAENTEYAQTMAAWLAASPALMKGFHKYAGFFQNLTLEPDLIHLLRLYRLYAGEKFAESAQDFILALNYLEKHLIPAYYPDVINSLGDITPFLEEQAPWESLEIIVKHVVNLAVGLDPQYQKIACSMWLKLFERHFSDKNYPSKKVLELKNYLAAEFHSDLAVLAELIVSESFKPKIIALTAHSPVADLRPLIAETIWALEITGQTPTYATGLIDQIVTAFLTQRQNATADFHWFLINFADDPAAVVEILKSAAIVLKKQKKSPDNPDQPNRPDRPDRIDPKDLQLWNQHCLNLGRSLYNLTKKDAKFRYSVLNFLKVQDDLIYILYGEWLTAIAEESDYLTYQNQYTSNVKAQAGSVFHQFFTNIMTMDFLNCLPPPQQSKYAAKLVLDSTINLVSLENQSKIINLASNELSFDRSESNSQLLAEKMNFIVRNTQPQEIFPRLQLWTAVNTFLNDKDPKYLLVLTSYLAAIDEDTYRECLENNILDFLDKSTSVKLLRECITFLASNKWPVFTEIYLDFLNTRLINDFKRLDALTIFFWLTPLKDGNLADMQAMVKKILFSKLKVLPKNLYTEFKNYLLTSGKNLAPDSKNDLNKTVDFLAEVDNNRLLLPGRLFLSLKRLLGVKK
jgi:hypothetical protein